ncbi:hypothetical protein [Leeuwenhoekiella marinoflava]|uniref:Uncharacterized protein n=2 Tax=Leeuwenhoekiella marinoflava TaxID=988 RepID=A0A4Q0PMR6_9FLAO|nr:hypothetical protein [Leeuwenhoekiella marinoflava]RXG31809.1 hypothetical protein DSL99_1633 [Leeuwenhoekiella marinoflava]SHF04356.1 hypothetical protein SAMN02745246_01549 [Leeuwenhoekiella marinoflava DSM 3653]
MSSEYHPKVDVDFIVEKIISSGKVDVDSKLTSGNSISFVLKGNKAFHKRFVLIRHIDQKLSFETAMAQAIKFKFITGLLEWCEKHKDWKEGEYISKNK